MSFNRILPNSARIYKKRYGRFILLCLFLVVIIAFFPHQSLNENNRSTQYNRFFTRFTLINNLFSNFKRPRALNIWASQEEEEKDTAYERSIILYNQGKLMESIESLHAFVSKNPENEPARMDLVILLREAGMLNEAYRHLDLMVRKFSSNHQYEAEWNKTAYLLGKPELFTEKKEFHSESPESLLWEGLGFLDLEKPDIKSAHSTAINKLKCSIQGGTRPKNPLAHYSLGRIYLEQEDFKKAEYHLKQTLREDAYFYAALNPLAQTYLGMEKVNEAYNLLKKASAFAPWDNSINEQLKQLISAHPSLRINEKKEKKERVKVTSPPRVGLYKSNGAVIPEIRVGLAEKVQDLQIKTGGPFTLIESGGFKRISGSAETVLNLRYQDGQIKVVKEDGTVLITTPATLSLTYDDSGKEKYAPTTAIFDLQFGQGQYWAGEEDRFYRGEIRFIANDNGMTIINRINLEEYLYSVLPAEMPSSWPKESLRAQAIAARSYALANMGSYEKRGFDVMGSVLSAAYKGAKNENPDTNWAVDSTRGQIITYNNEVIPAFFSANSGGYTEGQKSVWGTDNPYLKPIPDKLLSMKTEYLSPYQLYQWVNDRPQTYSKNSSSSYRWQIIVSREDIEARTRQDARKNIGKITSIITAGRGVSGRVKKIIIKGTGGEYELTGDLNIRNKLGGLRSTLFTIEPKIGKDGIPEFFLFTGAGWGHGVGLCQTGAAGMASAGYKAKEILTHYYSGVEISTIY